MSLDFGDMIGPTAHENTSTCNVVSQTEPIGSNEVSETQFEVEVDLEELCGSVEVRDENSEPYIGQVFTDLETVYSFYNNYARAFGFGVRKNSSSKSQVTKELIWKNYVCDKAGKKIVDSNDKTGIIKRRRNTRTDCPAKLDVRRDPQRNWVITNFVKEHNHILDTPRRTKKHRSHHISHRSIMVQKAMDQLHESGIRPSSIAKILNSTIDDTLVSTRNVVDHLRVLRKNNVGSEGVMVVKYLQDQLVLDPNFFFSLELDNDGCLRSIFWADSRARNDFLTFGDVIIFDVTYKTNKFMMPFAPFTGVNHHRQSILLGCALLADETEVSFIWLFQQWLKCMFDKSPFIIITDMDAAMFNAIKIVFPNTRHRFCSWHINKHLLENISEIRDCQSDFAQDYRRWYTSRTISQSETLWTDLLTKYDLRSNERRFHWVPAFLKNVFVADMTSTGRSESINAFFDGFVNSNTHLYEFVKQYENALKARRHSEELEDFQTMNSTATLMGNSSIEAHAGQIYTRKMFTLFQTEFKNSLDCWHEKLSQVDVSTTYLVGSSFEEKYKWYTVIYDDLETPNIKCECAKFETGGFLCKHVLHIMCKKHIMRIPDKYVLKRWTVEARNLLSYQHSTITDSGIIPVTAIMKWSLGSLCNKLVEKVSRSDSAFRDLYSLITTKLKEIDVECNESSVPTVGTQLDSIALSCNFPITSIRDPIQVRTKGRPKVASRIPSGIEVSQSNIKRRTCGSCGEKGHYASTCPRKSKDKMIDRTI